MVFFQLIDTTVVSKFIMWLNAVFYTSLATVIIVTSCFRSRLYCSSTSLLRTLESPTGFCTFTGWQSCADNYFNTVYIIGVVFQYILVNIVLWWFCNVAIFFHKVLRPFQANRFEKMGYNKYILAVVIILCKKVFMWALIFCTFKSIRYISSITSCYRLSLCWKVQVQYYSLSNYCVC